MLTQPAGTAKQRKTGDKMQLAKCGPHVRIMASRRCLVRAKVLGVCKTIGDYAVYLIVRSLICAIQCLEMETCRAWSRVLAYLACDLFRIRRTVVEENLQGSFPDLSADERHQLARRMWEHLFLMICEIAHIRRKMHLTNWRDYVTFGGRREIVQSLLDPRPTVLVSGHFGNFEIASYLAGLFGFRTYAIARPLDNPYGADALAEMLEVPLLTIFLFHLMEALPVLQINDYLVLEVPQVAILEQLLLVLLHPAHQLRILFPARNTISLITPLLITNLIQ